MDEQQKPQAQVRVHLTVPGPRAGVLYSLSIETINCGIGEVPVADIDAEVNAAFWAYDKAKKEMEARLAPPSLKQALRESLDSVTAARSGTAGVSTSDPSVKVVAS